MAKIIQLSTHISNLIAAGEVVERPASVVKELLENAVDAGATQVTVEIRDGGMTFLRLTDNGCGMSPEDAPTAFLRHATSKLRSADDLAAISTMGFRGEALAAIASVSRVDLLTKTPGAVEGTSLHLEGGVVTEQEEAGCPEGTTIIIRDLFFNTPARMKFMKSDTVEGSRVTAVVQQQAMAHPEVAVRLLRDGKQVLSTPGDGNLQGVMYCIFGKSCANMAVVDSQWEQYRLTGYVSVPSDARPSRSMQMFYVNDRPVKSKLLVSALEEAYRNQLMVGKFPACVLHLHLPPAAVDVNVHPAKTEVKFLAEKTVFDCVHYGVLAALNKKPDRPELKLPPQPQKPPVFHPEPQKPAQTGKTAPKQDFFRTMTAQEYQTFAAAMERAPQPRQEAAAAAASKLHVPANMPIREAVTLPGGVISVPPKLPAPPKPPETAPEPVVEQQELPMPEVTPWRMVGELFSCYIVVEQGDKAYLIDKHAAHERILFDKLRENPEKISAQVLLTPISCTLRAEAVGVLLDNRALLDELGFSVEEFGDNTLLLRQTPMELNGEEAMQTLEELSDRLLTGHREHPESVRDEALHTVACKAAIKAGWHSEEAELLVLARQVMEREDLKHCPHGRPICITLSKKQLEKQLGRT